MTLSPILNFNCDCNTALQLVKRQLETAGLRSIQTFDLDTVRDRAQNSGFPDTRTDDSHQQVVFLLVYKESEGPETLIFFGNRTQTSVSITEDQSSTNPLRDLISKTLTGNRTIEQSDSK